MNTTRRNYAITAVDVVIVQNGKELTIPFEATRCLVAKYFRRKKVAEIENATDDEILLGEW